MLCSDRLPNGLHGGWAKRALNAGKNVLVEKPFAANEEEASQCIALAAEKGLICRVGGSWAPHSSVMALSSKLKAMVCVPHAGGLSLS